AAIRAQLLLVRSVELPIAILERVELGPRRIAPLKRFETCGLDDPFLAQHAEPAKVHGAPDAARLPRSEANHVRVIVDRLAQPIDPSEEQRLIDRLRIPALTA